VFTYRTHEVDASKSGTATSEFPLDPTFEWANISRGNGVRQRGLDGNSLYYEQRSDDLPIPSSFETARPMVGVTGKYKPGSLRG